MYFPGDHLIANYQNVCFSVSGTSFSTAMMSGFLALVLSEYKNVFSKEEIAEIFKTCSVKLAPSWNDRVVFGMVDMRKTLLACRALKELKGALPARCYKKKFLENVIMINENIKYDGNDITFVHELYTKNHNKLLLFE